MATVHRADRVLQDVARASTLPVILIIAAMIVGLTAMLPLV